MATLVASFGEFFSLFSKKQSKWAWSRNHFTSTNLDSFVAKEVGIKVTETPSVEYATEAKADEANSSVTIVEGSSHTQNVIQGCTYDTNADANFDNVFLFDAKSGTADNKVEYHKATVKEIPNPTSTKKVLPNTGAEEIC